MANKKHITKEELEPWSFDRHDIVNMIQLARGYLGLVKDEMPEDAPERKIIAEIDKKLNEAHPLLAEQRKRHRPSDESGKGYHPELEKKEELKKLSEEREKLASIIRESLDKLEGLSIEHESINSARLLLEQTSRLLDVQKLRIDGASTQFKKVNLNELIKRTTKAHKKEAKFHLNLEEIDEIHGNESLLERMLNNLIHNSIRAVKEHGRYPEITIETKKLNSEILLHFHDNGPGFSKEILEKGPFKVRITNKKEHGGSGLAIVKEVVETHGGRIKLKPGPGAHFHIRFKRPRK